MTPTIDCPATLSVTFDLANGFAEDKSLLTAALGLELAREVGVEVALDHRLLPWCSSLAHQVSAQSRARRANVNAAPLTQLRVFLTVARLNSFAAAARELRVSASAVSQSVKQLEEQLRVTLLVRTTRSMALTDEGRRLVEGAGPALSRALASLTEVSARKNEVVGKLRLSIPRAAAPFVIAPMFPAFTQKYPRVQLELTLDERFVDIVAEGYDAGVRLSESIERDMMQARLSDAFRFIVVGSSSYLDKHGTPRRPEDLLDHDCITFKHSSGGLYAWELERGKKTWRIPVRGSVVTNDSSFAATLAEQGQGLTYAIEPLVAERLRKGTLQRVLDPYSAAVPGFFLYYPRRAHGAPALRAFIEVARSLLPRRA